MPMTEPTTDLVAWVADKHQEQILIGLFARHLSLDVRPFSVDLFVDPGCRTRGPQALRAFTRQYRFAILMFDHDGSGSSKGSAVELEAQLEQELSGTGWANRAAVIVIEPELERWVWSPSKEVDAVLGWSGRIPDLRSWLVAERFVVDRNHKPSDPKTAMEEALRRVGKRPSAAIFRRLADRVSFQHCEDRAFQKLWNCLKTWFPTKLNSESIG
jgi:hypothetical protein